MYAVLNRIAQTTVMYTYPSFADVSQIHVRQNYLLPGRVIRCAKRGVTRWRCCFCFFFFGLCMFFGVRLRAKTSRGASFEPSLAPPCGRVRTCLCWGGYRGGAFSSVLAADLAQ